jgi:nucleoside-diphosphate-sugar epimerase
MGAERRPRCAITGSSGYIGGYLSRYLQERGMSIRELRRTAPAQALSAEVVPLTLGQTVSAEVFEGVD